LTPALREKILDLLAHHNNMTIATIRPDGYPQATTVGYVNDELDIYFGCGAQSQKAQNLALNNRVSIAIDRDYENWNQIQGLSLAGTAARITDAKEIEKIAALMFEKFPQALDFGPDVQQAMVLFRVTPSVVSVLDYTKGFGHCELVTV
jgi:general stress protein 26